MVWRARFVPGVKASGPSIRFSVFEELLDDHGNLRLVCAGRSTAGRGRTSLQQQLYAFRTLTADPMLQYVAHTLREAVSAAAFADIGWPLVHPAQEVANVRDPDRVGEVTEHGLVVGRIPKEGVLVDDLVEVFSVAFFKEPSTAGELVKASVPAVDVNRRDLAGRASLFEARNDIVDGRVGQAGNIFTEVDSQVEIAVGLVGCQGSAGYSFEDEMSQSIKFLAVDLALAFGL